MNRQQYNYRILDLVVDTEICYELTYCYWDIIELIANYPDQRFGQIICNYVCSDYRTSNPSLFTRRVMDKLFPDNPDPFFEESSETYKRLENKYENKYRKL